jgi:NTP pyrophosphatase (non-canonical NTP hydrolase)
MKVYIKLKTEATLKKAIETFGVNSQEDVAIEEMSELTKAIIKNRRYGTMRTENNLLEEMADVFIMLMQLMIIHGFDYDIVSQKIARLKQRLESEAEDNA